ncbi:rhodanese-like domain-containing protein [Hymenobacter metallicola]|uniref:Rhodanese-like domain-containing protein n=1 Tax=Hymenobacter metallicola TaxID=2563114 RepID=A0A4Z0QHH7_9BACT|nr:rhodanese-like domain-containing protein [Hymenobacter metallicola]TGE28759.1 rhodanese-like domain-containing protein [Hymenobacter metallicola]
MIRSAYCVAVLSALLSAPSVLAQTAASASTSLPAPSFNGQQPAAPALPITPATEAKKLLKKRNVVVLDVRTPEEYATGHLQGAQNLNFRDPNFPTLLAGLDTTQTYVLYCASGNRSGKAAGLLQEKGFRKLVNAGAYKDLKAAGVKTE